MKNSIPLFPLNNLVFFLLSLLVLAPADLSGLEEHRSSTVVNNIAELEILNSNSMPAVAEVLGYFTPGDGGGGRFIHLPKGLLKVNRGTVVSSKFGAEWVWKRDFSGPLNVRWFGALGIRPKSGVPEIDETLPIQSAVLAAAAEHVRSVYLPAGTYFIDQIVLSPAMTLYGDGATDQTILTGLANATHDCLITDNGNAAKISLHDLQIKGPNNPNSPVKTLIKLGFGLIAPHGTFGILRSLWLRDLANGTGMRIKGNVGNYYDIAITNVKRGLEIWGEGNILSGLQVMGFTDTAIFSMCSFCKYNQTHIEGPREQLPGDLAANAVGIFLGRQQAIFTGVTFSLASPNNLKVLIEAPNNSTYYSLGFSIHGLTVTRRDKNSHFGHILHVGGAKELYVARGDEYQGSIFNYISMP